MYAIGWRDIQLVALISNVGTSHRSLTNAVRYRSKIIEPEHSVPYTQQYQFELERPEMVARFVSHWHEIDVNDHFRQGLFAIERLWPTQNWAVRLFSTILAVIVVNAYLAYLFDMSTIENNDPVNFYRFIDILVKQLINLDQHAGVPATRFAAAAQGPFHVCVPLSSAPAYEKLAEGNRAKRRCRVNNCNHICAYYCVNCSVGNRLFSVCGPMSGRHCLCQHVVVYQ